MVHFQTDRIRLLIVGFFISFFAFECLVAQEEPRKHVFTEFGKSYTFNNGKIRLTTVGRKQNFNWRDTTSYDKDINSPKSVSIHPDESRFYINSLEGFRTVVYDAKTMSKLSVIEHKFGAADTALWAKPSGLFHFNHHYNNPNVFSGKPVEGTFSHQGKYFWVPFYRRNFDINAQDPSAISVVDTKTNKIVRVFETGPLPKMVATSPNDHYIAVTHWGNNTVGILDISDPDMNAWHYDTCYVIDYQLKLDFSTTVPVNRDTNSGYCLRGTCFTPDGHYLLVGCMGGNGGIAVIDMHARRYLGRVLGCMSNLRHLLINNGMLYLSINKTGAVQRIPLKTFLASLTRMNKKTVTVQGWETCKVKPGARTIAIAPDGRYLYAACNFGSRLAVVDMSTFTMVGDIPLDSFPVGLDISADGKRVYVTSQGCDAVNILDVEYLDEADK